MTKLFMDELTSCGCKGEEESMVSGAYHAGAHFLQQLVGGMLQQEEEGGVGGSALVTPEAMETARGMARCCESILSSTRSLAPTLTHAARGLLLALDVLRMGVRPGRGWLRLIGLGHEAFLHAMEEHPQAKMKELALYLPSVEALSPRQLSSVMDCLWPWTTVAMGLDEERMDDATNLAVDEPDEDWWLKPAAADDEEDQVEIVWAAEPVPPQAIAAAARKPPPAVEAVEAAANPASASHIHSAAEPVPPRAIAPAARKPAPAAEPSPPRAIAAAARKPAPAVKAAAKPAVLAPSAAANPDPISHSHSAAEPEPDEDWWQKPAAADDKEDQVDIVGAAEPVPPRAYAAAARKQAPAVKAAAAPAVLAPSAAANPAPVSRSHSAAEPVPPRAIAAAARKPAPAVKAAANPASVSHIHSAAEPVPPRAIAPAARKPAPAVPAAARERKRKRAATAVVMKICTKDGVVGGQVNGKWLSAKMHHNTNLGKYYLAWKNSRGGVGSRKQFLSELVSEDVVRVVD
jgi:hypothetical protein